jgi:hypothetical protein
LRAPLVIKSLEQNGIDLARSGEGVPRVHHLLVINQNDVAVAPRDTDLDLVHDALDGAHVALGETAWREEYPMDYWQRGSGPWTNYGAPATPAMPQ